MIKKHIFINNKTQATKINTVTGIQAEQLRNSGKMIISRQFINPLQMWHNLNIGNESEWNLCRN